MQSTAVACPRLLRPGSTAATTFVWIERLLAATLVFNFVDTVLTIALVTLGLAVEANPLMAVLLDFSPVLFAVAKIMLVSLGVTILWRYREQGLAAIGTTVVFSVYGALMIYHMRSLSVLIQVMA